MPNALPITPPLGLPELKYELPKINNESPKNPSFNFQSIPVNQLLQVYFNEINNNSYVLSPEIVTDERLISFKYDSKKDGSLKLFTENLLKSLGYEITLINKTSFVNKIQENKKDELYDIYKPKNRNSQYLLQLIRPIFGSSFSSVSVVATNQNIDTSKALPGSSNALLDSNSDVLVYHSKTKEELNKINELLTKLDIEEKNLILKAYIYEVSYTNNDGSALGVIMNMAKTNNTIDISLGPKNPLQDVIKFTSNSLSLVFSSINKDSRFKLLSNPLIRIKNGKTQKLIVGASVPFASEVSYQGVSGTPVQSTKQIDTGFVLSITPNIKDTIIDIDLDQQISEAQANDKNTPTITKRQLTTSFSTKINEVVMLAGLTHNKESNTTDRPFILPFFNAKSDTKDKTEILSFVEILPVD